MSCDFLPDAEFVCISMRSKHLKMNASSLISLSLRHSPNWQYEIFGRQGVNSRNVSHLGPHLQRSLKAVYSFVILSAQVEQHSKVTLKTNDDVKIENL